ncbi:type IV secretion protein [Tahibacter amnicola]|uniref:Type IV secretion protein n=1 Tax=Tahibacter amnicola TaxID=2976241 RepID=A0ABY6BE93_9GAMM|nr:type IV secretion protein [Tahibacter amnicola]UXI68343.1 type IV secretion protein [Tahibacter amnicola]
MSGAPSATTHKPASGDGALWAAIVTPVIAYFGVGMLWGGFHTAIATAYAYLRYAELWLVYAAGKYLPWPGLRSAHDWVDARCAPDGLVGPCQRDFSTVPWEEISASSQTMNLILLAVLLALCVRWFLRANRTHPKFTLTRRHSVSSLVKEVSGLYPHLRLFGKLDLVEQPLDHPVFGMSLTSRQFAFQHRLIAGWRLQGNERVPTLDRVRAAAVLREQLGALWRDTQRLTPAETLVLAIALPRAAATDPNMDDAQFETAIADSDALVRWCWDQFRAPESEADMASALRPAIDLTAARALIEKYRRSPAVAPLFQRHAYVRTILCAALTQARRLGVLPPAEMRWLRFFDRPVWYVVESVGRQASFAEAAGVQCHYFYESRAHEALVQPQLGKAVDALEHAISHYRYSATDQAAYGAAP